MENFVLKDALRHKAYSFPQTVLHYRKAGLAPDPDKDALYVNGVKTPYETCAREGGYLLTTIADLPCGEQREFVWKKENGVFAPVGSDNGLLAVKSVEGGLYDVETKDKTFFYRLSTKFALLEEHETVSGGAIESVFEKTLVFEGERRYRFILKLKRGFDFLEIYETMEGFSVGEASLEISWRGFDAEKRYTLDRGEEKIDAYIDETGKFPFVINPFAPRCSWWDQRYVAYVDGEGFFSGILLHDLKNYDDEEYAIWSSRDALAFALYEDKIVGGIKSGKRAFMHVLCGDKKAESLGKLYLRYYSIVSLDKVKDYVLEWEDDQNDYPKYFSVEKNKRWSSFYGNYVGKPTAEDMMNILDRDTSSFTTIEQNAPVSSRAYRGTWSAVFDLTAKELSKEEFDRVRAAMAFVCYTYADENYYPIENALGGHPNFLTDILGTVAVFASLLGKKHPMHDKWLAYYEKGLARNLKYHIRPSVEKWRAKGGRWTENVGCYMLGFISCIVSDCHIVYALNDGEMPALYPHFKPMLEFLVNMTAPENEKGRRLYMPMGAHAATGEFGEEYGHGYFLAMIQLADMLKYYEPLLAEYILHNYRNQSDFDGVIDSASISGWTYARFTKNTFGTSPNLYSCKYTGLGYMLRDRQNTPQEMQVFLQQIDEGPNYRWGRAAEGGCGEIYYYANAKKYTDHSPEDVGDENRGDCQSCTNFGVLIDHEYRSVGRNDLREPLMDFDFVKYARVNAGKRSAPYYKYRALMMVENRYIAVYDAVADAMQYGRFTWAQVENGTFPTIKNLRPGVEGVLTGGGEPVDCVAGTYRGKGTKVLQFDGRGDFLTIATHLRGYDDERAFYSIDRASFGAEIVFPQKRDKICFDSAKIRLNEDDFSFVGYVGYATEEARAVKMAIFDGEYIKKGGVSLKIPYEKDRRHGMSLIASESGACGKCVFETDGEVRVSVGEKRGAKVFLDGKEIAFVLENGEYVFVVPSGEHSYNIGEVGEIAKVKIDGVISNKDGCIVKWEHALNAEEYEISLSDDLEYTWKTIGKVRADFGENSFVIEKLDLKKYHVRVRGVAKNAYGEWSHAYPVYVTDDVPHCPDGLRVVKSSNGFVAVWGEVLGCGEYRLYKVGDKIPRYIGKDRQAEVDEGEYFVTAVNGNGESSPSLVRSTKSELATWDNHPEKGFVRDSRSNEHGYCGFDFIGNKKRECLNYED